MLNAICAGCSQTGLCMAVGVLSRKCKKKTLSRAGSHMSMYMQKHASTHHTRSHSVWVQDCLHLKAVVKNQKGTERGCALQPLQSPAKPCLPKASAHTRLSPTTPRLRLCPVPSAAPELTELSECEISLHRTACSRSAAAQKTCAGTAVSFVYREVGLLPNSSAPTASIKCVNHFLAIRAPEKS